MAVPTRLIKRRIKSVRATRKIMKAMELVAASKMRKAVSQTVSTRPYASLIHQMTEDIRRLTDPERHPFLKGNASGKTLLVAIASDRGLCGGFNAQLVKLAVEFLRVRREDVEIATVGRRAEFVARRSGRRSSAAFDSLSNGPSFARLAPIAKYILDAFTSGEVGRVFIAYTDFKSMMLQVPNVVQLLPVIPEAETEPSASTGREQDAFEPNPDAVLERLLPAMVEMRLYQAILESAASEQSARMLAMKNAGDAAGDMLDDLTFTLNQARQASITREISEISAGKAAIE